MNKQSHFSSNGEPFFWPGGEPGVLLIHGFLTTPDEMRPLGAYLAAAGMTVNGIRLRGHGTQPEDLARVTWQDWLADVDNGLTELRQYCTQICVAGLSLGGALALHAAARHPLTRVVTFSAPDSALVGQPLLRLVKPGARLLHFFPKIGSDIRDPAMRHAHFTYRRIPLSSVLQVAELIRTLDTSLSHVTAPTLLVQARHDRVVPPATPQRIAARLGGPSRLLWVEHGGHTVVMDYDRDLVFAATLAWLRDAGDNV
ncbi:MAG TPA: alpha/beta fold hydrolase [Anaerolineae bacterium]|nr:alpha/beta fold hydrolase [Anaerolineae bacterium]HQH38241.1 alpha/beta fold hydrolase [Anaerolineae bacterium]